jgi:predicted nucleic acid-binding protein
MTTYFLDTSAIIKHYFPEQGHVRVNNLYDPKGKHDLYISQIALVEVVASICRKAREQNIMEDARDALINAFRRDSQKTYSIQRVMNATYIAAGNLCRVHRLRAYDAMQLACALRLREKSISNEPLVPTFVCADNQFVMIAVKEGLSVENPNNHP